MLSAARLPHVRCGVARTTVGRSQTTRLRGDLAGTRLRMVGVAGRDCLRMMGVTIIRTLRMVGAAGTPLSTYRRHAARATAGIPPCIAKQVTRPVRNREVRTPEPQLA